ncbi:hypothetical protein SORBI_3010G152850 [Sorghum bicolor]|uniref:Uncharacterized protein n=1 Tax=Sorghum bicolor TaxID=4558 RepID=A0A1W0VT75_SORBI|nr:hypothetical protein SORBI_3010G152850 [Sorghum bicolor]
MDMALSKLNSGGWAHICPEGSHLMDEGKNHCSYQERCCKMLRCFRRTSRMIINVTS